MGLHSELRARTLANNLIWLASFGCEIVRTPNVIKVTHPDIPEYNAHMIVGWAADTHEAVELLLRSEKSPTLYIDEPFISDASPLLSRHQMQPVFSSRVKCAQLKSKGKTPSNFELHRAERGDVERWSNLYSIGFGREESEVVDRKRWQRSFTNPAVSHWFFTEHGRNVGVMQTCSAEDVVGVYSVTLLPEYRSMRRTIALGKALQWEFSPQTIYFERVSRKVWTPGTPALRHFKTLRQFLVYRKKS